MLSIIAIVVLTCILATMNGVCLYAVGENDVKEPLEFSEEITQFRESNPEYDKLLKALEILQFINTTFESPEQVDKKILDTVVLVHEIEYAWYLALTDVTNTTSANSLILN